MNIAVLANEGKEVKMDDNMSYERMQKIEAQREVQNSIAQVVQDIQLVKEPDHNELPTQKLEMPLNNEANADAAAVAADPQIPAEENESPKFANS